jgi:hypothetical protein
MPVGYKIDKEHKLVMSTAYGVVTREDILFHQQRLLADADFSRNFSQLADFTRMAKLEVNATDIASFAAKTVFAPESRRAIIVPDDEAFGLARMFEILRDAKGDDGIRVFRSVEEGFDWIFPDGSHSYAFSGSRVKERETQKKP